MGGFKKKIGKPPCIDDLTSAAQHGGLQDNVVQGGNLRAEGFGPETGFDELPGRGELLFFVADILFRRKIHGDHMSDSDKSDK